MANYYGQTRTNYFAIKDSASFIAEAEGWNVEVITKEVDGVTLYGLMDKDPDGAGLSWSRFGEDDAGEEIEEERDWLAWIASHLEDGHVAIMLDIGSEKYRYLNAIAWAVNSKGETRKVGFENIYELAKELGDQFTTAEY